MRGKRDMRIICYFRTRKPVLERGNNLPLSECIATCYDYIIIASGLCASSCYDYVIIAAAMAHKHRNCARKTVGNHRPHVKDERTIGPYSSIETSSTCRDVYLNPDSLSFYETLCYSSLFVFLTCGPTGPPVSLLCSINFLTFPVSASAFIRIVTRSSLCHLPIRIC
jgi:hypothetical protein